MSEMSFGRVPTPLNFGGAIRRCFARYSDFQGRARRAEYWYFALFCLLVDVVLAIIGNHLLGTLIHVVVGLGLALPASSVAVRRLHDLDRSGWWCFINFVPVLGLIVLIYWFCQRGTVGMNRFGVDPLIAG
jgi:uncharacterized membrane protein YhaH (DUF805 family)